MAFGIDSHDAKYPSLSVYDRNGKQVIFGYETSNLLSISERRHRYGSARWTYINHRDCMVAEDELPKGNCP